MAGGNAPLKNATLIPAASSPTWASASECSVRAPPRRTTRSARHVGQHDGDTAAAAGGVRGQNAFHRGRSPCLRKDVARAAAEGDPRRGSDRRGPERNLYGRQEGRRRSPHILIVDPPNGKVPPLVKAAQDRNATLGGRTREPSRVRTTNDSRSVVKPSAGSDQAT
jgi:hypothetical protein